jgi:hypothetical protein
MAAGGCCWAQTTKDSPGSNTISEHNIDSRFMGHISSNIWLIITVQLCRRADISIILPEFYKPDKGFERKFARIIKMA